MSLPGKTCFQNDLSYVERDVNLLTHLFRYLLAAKFQAGYITPTAQSLILGDVKNVPNFWYLFLTYINFLLLTTAASSLYLRSNTIS